MEQSATCSQAKSHLRRLSKVARLAVVWLTLFLVLVTVVDKVVTPASRVATLTVVLAIMVVKHPIVVETLTTADEICAAVPERACPHKQNRRSLRPTHTSKPCAGSVGQYKDH